MKGKRLIGVVIAAVLVQTFVNVSFIFVAFQTENNRRDLTTFTSRLVGRSAEGFHRCDAKRVIDYFKTNGSWPDPYVDLVPCHKIEGKDQ